MRTFIIGNEQQSNGSGIHATDLTFAATAASRCSGVSAGFVFPSSPNPWGPDKCIQGGQKCEKIRISPVRLSGCTEVLGQGRSTPQGTANTNALAGATKGSLFTSNFFCDDVQSNVRDVRPFTCADTGNPVMCISSIKRLRI